MRDRVLASLECTAAMIALPSAYLLSQQFGPSSRVVFYPYLPIELFVDLLVFATTGAVVGAEAHRLLRSSSQDYAPLRLALGVLLSGCACLLVAAILSLLLWRRLSVAPWIASVVVLIAVGSTCGGVISFKAVADQTIVRRLPVAKLVLLGLVMMYGLIPQLRAFPARGALAERDAWARARVREYPSLVRVVKALPAVIRDVGRVVQVAPTGNDPHSFAREMDGDDLLFTLQVVGSKGTGTLRADCTIDGERILDWRSGTWSFNGTVTRIDSVPGQRR
jgi:hypothetical protein